MNPTDEVFSFNDFETLSLFTKFNEKLQERIFCVKRSLKISFPIFNNSKVNYLKNKKGYTYKTINFLSLLLPLLTKDATIMR
jgi:hypothetical protein